MTIGERIVKLREKNNISQGELAKALGIAQQSLSNYESSNRTLRPDMIIKLCNYFNVTSDYLLGISDSYQTLDVEFKAVCNYLGINDLAVLIIRYVSNNKVDKASLEMLLCNPEFLHLLDLFSKLLVSSSELFVFTDYYDNAELFRRCICSNSYFPEMTAEIIESLGISKETAEHAENISNSCDICRYRIISLIEKILDAFDRRSKIKNLSEAEAFNYTKVGSSLSPKFESYSQEEIIDRLNAGIDQLAKANRGDPNAQHPPKEE